MQVIGFWLILLCLLCVLVNGFHIPSSLESGNNRRSFSNVVMMNMKKPLRPTNILGKGFGKTIIFPKLLSNTLKQTRPGEIRKIEGHYKRTLERSSDLFNEIITKESTGEYIIQDIYARSEITCKTFFLGRIIFPSKYKINNALKSLEILLVEYAKTIQPEELGRLLLIGYPQLLYTNGYSNELIENYQGNLTRYYHFDKDTEYFDYTEIGFQPYQPPSNLSLSSDGESKDGVEAQTPLSYVYCDDEGKLWDIEEVERVESGETERPIFSKRGAVDLHGMMNKLLTIPNLDNSVIDEAEGDESEKEQLQ